MADMQLKKIDCTRAVIICQDIELDDKARSLLVDEITPQAFLAQLLDLQLYTDAVRFLARALPKREATWWACICTRHVIQQGDSSAMSDVLETAEKWAYEPTEEYRRAAHAAALSTRFDHPACWAAMAAFWSEGSMAPPNVPVVPPADNLTGKAVAGAIMLAAVQNNPDKAMETYRTFIRQGIDIAEGGNGRINTS